MHISSSGDYFDEWVLGMHWLPTLVLVLALFVVLLGLGFQDEILVLIGAVIAIIGGTSWWWFRVRESMIHA